MKNYFPISRVLSPHPAHIKMKTTLPFNKEKNNKKHKLETTHQQTGQKTKQTNHELFINSSVRTCDSGL